MENKNVNYLAQNLILLRKNKKLSQLELGEKFNYSDKAISKWERGDGMPDILVLNDLAKFFDVTLDDFLNKSLKANDLNKKAKSRSKFLITLLSVGLVWFVAMAIFMTLAIVTKDAGRYVIIFLYAVPISSIVLIVFTSLWFGYLLRALSVSLLTWSLATSVYFSFSIAYLWTIFILAAIFQALIILWFVFRNKKKQTKNSNL